jgi:hypothetical protein
MARRSAGKKVEAAKNATAPSKRIEAAMSRKTAAAAPTRQSGSSGGEPRQRLAASSTVEVSAVAAG